MKTQTPDLHAARPASLNLNTTLPPLSGFTATKDIGYHPLFIGRIFPWIWRLYMYRLTAAGRWFLMITVVFTLAVAAVGLQYQFYIPFSFCAAVWLIAFAAILLFQPRVTLKAQHTDRICAGETLMVDLEVQQNGRTAAADLTVLPQNLPPGIDAVQEDGVRLPVMEHGAKQRVRLQIRCNKRGVYRLWGYRVQTDYPFGILRAYRSISKPKPLLVYPFFTRLSQLRIPSGRRYHPGGVALASNLGESFEFIGNREYQEGDNVRDIDWRATARLLKPIVREYREEYFFRVAVVLDTYVPPDQHAVQNEAFERAISLGAAVSDYMSRQDYLVDLFAAGPNLYHLTAGRSLAYLDQILDILACVDTNPQEPFAVLEPEILENLSTITTVICIFLDWNETRQAFVERLAASGAGVKVIVVRDTPCTLDPSAASGLVGDVPVISNALFAQGIEEL